MASWLRPSTEQRSATFSLGRLLREGARIDRTQSDPMVAARNALGVAAPLVLGALVATAAGGLPAAIGALQTSFADRPGPYRLRLLRMSLTALAAGVTSALAVACSGSDLLSALLLLATAFGAGLLLAAGPSGAQVGIAATAAALILGHQVTDVAAAPHVGALVLAGGLLQAALAIAGWPLGRHRPERRALAALYRSLAGLARRPPRATQAPPLGAELADVRRALYGLGHDHGPSVEAYRVLLAEAERVRRELLVLGGYADRLADDGDRDGSEALRAVLDGSAAALDEVADALERGRTVSDALLADVRKRVEAASALLAGGDSAAGEAVPEETGQLTRQAASVRVRALAGQLRAVAATTRIGAIEGRRVGEGQRAPTTPGLRDPLATVRANLTPASAVFRHAVRLALVVAGSDLVLRLAGVPRGYWVPLTALVVLRPDFAATFQRSTLRVLGTVVGLIAATVLVHIVPGGQWYAIGLVAVFVFGMRLAGPSNLGLSAVCLAALVVVLLSLAGVSPHATVVRRGLDTAIGGGLALLAILIWPAWERTQVRTRLGELLAAYRSYLRAVADLSSDSRRMQSARRTSRLARMSAQASVDRARSEPVGGAAQVELGESVLAQSHRAIHATMTIDALRPALRRGGPVPELAELLAAADRALGGCEEALRSGVAPRAGDGLRGAQEHLFAALRADPQRFGGSADAGALAEASDRLANSVDTLVDELRRQLADTDSATG